MCEREGGGGGSWTEAYSNLLTLLLLPQDPGTGEKTGNEQI